MGVAAQEIVPAEAYSAADLNYNVDGCRANNESNDKSARPAIGSARTDLTGVDTLYLGYPIWWGDAAAIMRTYVESVGLAGKTVVPFCTSGGSGIGQSVSTLQGLANGGSWQQGMRFDAGASESEVARLIL